MKSDSPSQSDSKSLGCDKKFSVTVTSKNPVTITSTPVRKIPTIDGLEDGEIDSDSQQSTQNSQQSSQNSQPSQTSSQQNTSCVSSQDSILDSTVINRDEPVIQPLPVVRTSSNSTLESNPTTSQSSSSFGGGVSGNQDRGLFSGPEISDMSQDSKTMIWHREDKLREQNKENIPESLRLSKIENKAKIETFSTEKTPNKPIPPVATGSSKRKSQTPMKLTADRNEAPPKKKKKLKRKSKEKSQKHIQSPQRKHLLVDKNCDTSPCSEDSQQPSNPFTPYKVKESEPHSPFSNTSNKSAEFNDSETAELRIEAETDARSSFFDQNAYFSTNQNSNQSESKIIVNEIPPEDRIHALGLDMTENTTLLPHNKSHSPSKPDMVAICGLEMSDTKLSPPSRSISTTPPRTTSPPPKSPLVNQNRAKVTKRTAKRNVFHIETNNPLIKWARDLNFVLERDKAMSRQFQSSPNIFMNNLARVNVDFIVTKAIDLNRNITRLSPTISPKKDKKGNEFLIDGDIEGNGESSTSSSFYDDILEEDFSMPPRYPPPS